MDVYLMQHGVAATDEDDSARPLTDEGRADVERVAERVRAAGVRIDRCVHSDKTRAEQTAQILADAVGATLEAREGLHPTDPAQPIADWLESEAEATPDGSIVVVGHLPALDRLASILVSANEDARAVLFCNAGLVKLVPRDGASGFAIAWFLPPELAG